MKTSITIKRLKAFAIDYILILAYIGVLLLVTLLISRIFQLELVNTDPVVGEFIAFATLTLPVILYFTLSENSNSAGTIGKRRSGLQVVNKSLTRATAGQLLLRNCIKFLPWELAHFFLYRLFYFTQNNKPIPGWVLTGLTVAQVLAVVYLLCIIFNKNDRSIYEVISGTRVVQNKNPTVL